MKITVSGSLTPAPWFTDHNAQTLRLLLLTTELLHYLQVL